MAPLPLAVGPTPPPTPPIPPPPPPTSYRGEMVCGDSVTGDTTGAPNRRGTRDNNAGGDHMYNFSVAEGGTQLRITTCGMTNFDSYLRLFRQGRNGSTPLGSQGAFNDDTPGCAGYSSQLDTAPLAPGSYIVVVEGYSTSEGLYRLNLTGVAGEPCFVSAPPTATPPGLNWTAELPDRPECGWGNGFLLANGTCRSAVPPALTARTAGSQPRMADLVEPPPLPSIRMLP